MGPASVQIPALMEVEVVCSVGPGEVARCRLALPAGSTAGEVARAALAHWGSREGADPSNAADSEPLLAIWGRRCALDKALRDGDRLEWLRPLQVDPKEARRLRYRRTGGRQGGIERGRAARLREAADGESGTPGRARGNET